MKKINQLLLKRNSILFIFLIFIIIGIIFFKILDAYDVIKRQKIVDQDVVNFVALVEKNNSKEEFKKYIDITESFKLAKPNRDKDGGIATALEEGFLGSIWVTPIMSRDKDTKNIFVQNFISTSNVGLYEDGGNILLLGDYIQDENLRAVVLLHELVHIYLDIHNPERTRDQLERDYYKDETLAYTEEFKLFRELLNSNDAYGKHESLISSSLLSEWNKNNIVFVGYDQKLFTEIAQDLYPNYQTSKNKDFLPILFWMNLNFKVIENNYHDSDKQMKLKEVFLKKAEELGFGVHE
jgi:hypothetical protein